ncbi:MAG: molybdopterin converting factor subunit 1 [Dongiaceae bacterium]
MKLMYFAWLRQKIGCGNEERALPADVVTVEQLLAWLDTLGPGYRAALADRKSIRVAVNHEYVGADHPVKQGDEVALFPPVTGG